MPSYREKRIKTNGCTLDSLCLSIFDVLKWQGGFLMCVECQKLAEQFAITSRLYAETAARVGTTDGPLPDHAQLIADAEEALHQSQCAFAVLKEHLSSHHRFTAAKLSVVSPRRS